MEYKELFLEAIQSLRKNVMRTALTMFGIVIGISAVILIVSIGQGAVRYITNELTAFGTNFFTILPGTTAISQFTGGQRSITYDDALAIARDPTLTNVKTVIPLANASVVVSANGINKVLIVNGTTHEAVSFLKPTMIYGEFLSGADVQVLARVAVIGVDAAKDFFGEETNPVGEIIRIDNKPFRIIGVAHSSSGFFGGFFNNTIFIPIEVIINQITGPDAGIQRINVEVHDENLIDHAIGDVSRLLRERHNLGGEDEDDFVIQGFQDALATVQTITNLLTVIVAAISGISLVVGGVGVMNIMLVTVTERTREIGILKAIGAKQRDILAQFLMEAVVITLIGGVIGIVIGITGAFLITLFVPIPFVVSVSSVVIAVGVAVLVGVVFGLYPARRAAKLSPIDALRYE